MHTVVVGAGPAGLVTAMALARHRHEVTVVDRDAGPGDDGSWERRGVMQFHQPHVFRSMTRTLLMDRLPDVLDAVLEDGAVPVTPPGAPEAATLLRCRRETYERSLRRCATTEPRIGFLPGHADALLRRDHQVYGVAVDGHTLEADLVVDATGRRGRLAEGLRPPLVGGDCGFAYASRLYRLRDGAEPGPVNGPPGFAQFSLGYALLVFPHDARTFSVLLVRATTDKALAALRHEEVWTAVTAALPPAAAWTDPERAVPRGPVRAGAGLTNHYQGQAPDVRGLLFAGDSVCTTNPVGGRGASLALAQAFALVDTVEGFDAADRAAALDDWATGQLRPWYEDAVGLDAATHRVWEGRPVDPDGPISTDLVMAAAEVDPRLQALLVPYNAMVTTPDALTVAHDQVRAMLREGWRPAPPPGPTRDELVAAAEASLGFALADEEVPQQRRRLLGEHTGEDLGPVVEPAVSDHVPQ
jgi:2-polyprenyl-6-methoxyphenol hydroxylase-like FAD-dependent oxidoreductase